MSKPKVEVLSETRLFDLVRYMRAELLDAKLITREEFAHLLTAPTEGKPGQGSISARRLETYDGMRRTIDDWKEVARLQAVKTLESRTEVEALRAEVARLRGQTCACGHPRDAHATGGCAHTLPSTVEPWTGRSIMQMCPCKAWAARDTPRPEGGDQ